jgi:acyloxyacyl hydrolase
MMSIRRLSWIGFLLVIFLSVINGSSARGVNGGADCASCTIVLGVVEHLSILYNETIVQSLERFCNYLPTQFKTFCKAAVDFAGRIFRFSLIQEKKNDCLGPIIIDGFLHKETPDVICHSLKICTDDAGQPECRLFPSNTSSSLSLAQRGANLRQRHPSILSLSQSKACEIPGIKEICKLLENVFNNHIPLMDLDGDHFGTEEALRGTSWRGKDCDDFSKKVRPGARTVNGDAVLDENCNGIFGLDSATGQPWETEFCNDTQRIGIAVLGDSISAHFHIPEEWLDARQLTAATFEHLLLILDNELDWPQLSGTTGHVNISWPNIEGN